MKLSESIINNLTESVTATINLQKLFSNIEKQNELREELNQPTLSVRAKIYYDVEFKYKNYKTFKDFMEDFNKAYTEDYVNNVLNTEFEINDGYADISEDIEINIIEEEKE